MALRIKEHQMALRIKEHQSVRNEGLGRTERAHIEGDLPRFYHSNQELIQPSNDNNLGSMPTAPHDPYYFIIVLFMIWIDSTMII